MAHHNNNMTDAHLRRGHPVTFGLIILISLIELILSAFVVNRFNKHRNEVNSSEKHRTRYTLFASIWTFLLSTLLLWHFQRSQSRGMPSNDPAVAPAGGAGYGGKEVGAGPGTGRRGGNGGILSSLFAHLAFLAITWCIWFAAAVVLTHMLGGGVNCGLPNPFAYCRVIVAMEALAWILLVLLTFAMLVVMVRACTSGIRRAGHGLHGTGSGAAAGDPALAPAAPPAASRV
ncbi:unnamed protein product [Mycena citricolor]|uniref:MARVEL domain-containing protein n=1 Tax=Mycena citricolor TaxID=2018698 RepID=A0AAD2HTT8_9AGAR|nr:unnamed protein product [Mycena citricolor]